MSSLAIQAILRQKKIEKDYKRQQERLQKEKSFKASLIGGVPDSDILFYNILVHNNNTGFDEDGNATSVNTDIQLRFNETRSQPYINCADNYYMSVIRFDVDTASLPVFIPQPIAGAPPSPLSGYFETIYSFYINGNETKVQWIPQDLSIPIPTVAPYSYSDYQYFYCFSYNYFLDLLNTQISGAYGGTGPAPFLRYSAGNIDIIGSVNEWATDINGGIMGINTLSFNPALYSLFSSFPAIKKISGNYQILFVQNASGLNTITVETAIPPAVSTPYQAIVTSTENSPLPIWNPVESVVFTTNLLPVVSELIAKPQIFGKAPVTGPFVPPSNAQVQNILTDFASPLNYGVEYKPTISYTPVSEFRLTDMFDEKPVRDLDIQVFWKDYYGQLHPFILYSGGTATIKIMFRKKDF
jgi:hypothetical protein